MTTMDDDWEALASQLTDIPEPTDVVDVTKLTSSQLLEILTISEEDLMDAQQAVFPTQQWARDAHSIRAACRIEYNKRLDRGDFDRGLD